MFRNKKFKTLESLKLVLFFKLRDVSFKTRISFYSSYDI
ncbi:hypothetical protein LEP1GSC008_1731 [Leptospira kirschneri serovar Bulgarica str. Nikolaevo]|uniref:Uncharacterized protein n=1 Tax=Leptospira kirschneri serovar Bulgarica str. Nikolaevo TaxID=1240687 RepID=M6F3P4_9LEPT|nr:hypothetical protein LEP1GSC008_1731 [Leptospira kirschneri serovar Bulgarica str. Nikolaevo]